MPGFFVARVVLDRVFGRLMVDLVKVDAGEGRNRKLQLRVVVRLVELKHLKGLFG